MARVLVPLAEGFEDLEAVTIVDVLRRGGVEVVTASISDAPEVRGARGIVMRADALLADVAACDYAAIVLPGGEGVARLKSCPLLIDRLRRQADAGLLIGAICAAPTLLVEAGLLDEETQVTCYPTCQEELDREWSPAPVVADGRIITGQAPGSALLFSLVVLQTIAGAETAMQVAGGMVTDVLD